MLNNIIYVLELFNFLTDNLIEKFFFKNVNLRYDNRESETLNYIFINKKIYDNKCLHADFAIREAKSFV